MDVTQRRPLWSVGDRVSFVQVHEDRVVRITGTVVGFGIGNGVAFLRIDGRPLDEWRPETGVKLVRPKEDYL